MKANLKYLSLAPIKIINRYKYLILFFILYFAYFFVFHNGETNCLIKRTIGIPCPGCGMTRAALYLISFDFKNAFIFHPLIYVMPFLVIIFLYQDTRLLQSLAHAKVFFGIIVLMFLVVYIIRMILYFPNTEPMDYFHNPFILKFLFK
ncbi:MAG: DUF2752 domain-containing protein [Firmicutes bacterium]|nr:DUF2752 domain-containing protein [Bacillota bacterium]